MKSQNLRLKAFLERLLETPATLTILSTIALSASVNLLTGLLSSTESWPASQFVVVIVAAIAYLIGGGLLAIAETKVGVLRQTSRDYVDLQQGIAQNSRTLLPPMIGGLATLAACTVGMICWSATLPSAAASRESKSSAHRSTGQPVRVRFGYQQTGLYAHLFTAKGAGFLLEEGIDAELLPFVSANQMMEALLAGGIEVAGLTNLEVALSVESKDPGKFKFLNTLVWQHDSYPDFLLATKSSGLTDVTQLEGRVIGVHPGTAVNAFCREVLKKKGVNPDKCTLLEMPPSTLQTALAVGKIDAAYCMDPVASSLISQQLCIPLLKNPLSLIFEPPIPIAGTAVSTNLINANVDAVRRIRRALDRSIAYINNESNSDLVRRHVVQFTGIEKDEVSQMRLSRYWQLEAVDQPRVKELTSTFVNLGISKPVSDVNSMFLSRLVEFEKTQ